MKPRLATFHCLSMDGLVDGNALVIVKQLEVYLISCSKKNCRNCCGADGKFWFHTVAVKFLDEIGA
jgi:hypothetical protein